MKAEDIERMYCRYMLFSDAPTVPWPSLSQRARMAFAAICRDIEQHGVERAKALASATCLHECRECGGEGYDECADDDGDCGQCKGSGDVVDKVAIDWSALDAEIRKENEG